MYEKTINNLYGFKYMENITAELNDQKRKVDFNSYDMSVKELISMVNDDIIDIAPEYQRQFRWDDSRQSALIESIFWASLFPHCLWQQIMMGPGK